jgi:hypothetical protein
MTSEAKDSAIIQAAKRWFLTPETQFNPGWLQVRFVAVDEV